MNRISEEAVQAATGWGWNEWFTLLDEQGAQEMDHKEIVKLLRSEGQKNAWWNQMITVEYKRSRGLRKEGETADAGFEVGVRRTFEIAPKRVWDVISRPSGIRVWLGEGASLELKNGASYETEDGATGEVRSIRPGERIRLSWRPLGWDEHSIIQVTVISLSGKSTLAFHQEGLPNEKERERARKRWTAALNAIEELL